MTLEYYVTREYWVDDIGELMLAADQLPKDILWLFSYCLENELRNM